MTNTPAARVNAAPASLPRLVDGGSTDLRRRLVQARGGSNSTVPGPGWGRRACLVAGEDDGGGEAWVGAGAGAGAGSGAGEVSEAAASAEVGASSAAIAVRCAKERGRE